MPYNANKVVVMSKAKDIKAKDFIAYVYPGRSGNSSYVDVGQNVNPKADTIERIADLLQCSIDELFDREARYVMNHVEGDNNTVASYNVTNDPDVLMATVSHLREVIVRQDQIIAEQNHRIDQLIELAKR